MMYQMLIVFGILAGAVGLFAWGRPRFDIVAILVVLSLMLSRVLTPQESLVGFGDPVVILIAAIFIVGEALVNTGVAHRLGEAVLKAGAGNETRLIVLIMILAAGIGAFMSSSAIVAMFIPVVLTIAHRTGLNRKRMLMPLSVAALISGMMTLIASSPNMIIDNALRTKGIPRLSFFSWTPFGLAVLATSIAFMLWGRRLLGKQLAAKGHRDQITERLRSNRPLWSDRSLASVARIRWLAADQSVSDSDAASIRPLRLHSCGPGETFPWQAAIPAGAAGNGVRGQRRYLCHRRHGTGATTHRNAATHGVAPTGRAATQRSASGTRCRGSYARTRVRN